METKKVKSSEDKSPVEAYDNKNSKGGSDSSKHVHFNSASSSS